MNRFFKASINRTPQEMLDELRFADACRLLSEGASLKEVAASTGFADAAHLCHRFRRRFGCTPVQWVCSHPRVMASSELKENEDGS